MLALGNVARIGLLRRFIEIRTAVVTAPQVQLLDGFDVPRSPPNPGGDTLLRRRLDRFAAADTGSGSFGFSHASTQPCRRSAGPPGARPLTLLLEA